MLRVNFLPVHYHIAPFFLFFFEKAGFALLKFRDKVDLDPYGALANWNTDDDDPCEWLGVHCVDGEVQKL